MNALDEKILCLKAALWENGNVNSLLSKAIRAYMDQKPSSLPIADTEMYINGQEVVVVDVPHVIHNNQVHENLLLMAALEGLLEEKYNNPPAKVQFKSLLR